MITSRLSKEFFGVPERPEPSPRAGSGRAFDRALADLMGGSEEPLPENTDAAVAVAAVDLLAQRIIDAGPSFAVGVFDPQTLSNPAGSESAVETVELEHRELHRWHRRIQPTLGDAAALSGTGTGTGTDTEVGATPGTRIGNPPEAGPVPESSKAPPVTPGDSVSDNSVPSDSVPSDTVPAELPAGQFLARIKPVKRSVKTAAPVEVRERNALPIELPPVPIPAPPRSPRIIEATPEVRESVPPVRRSPGARTESVPTKELPADLAFSVEANESIRPRPTAAGAGLTTATAPAREATPPQGLVPPEQIPERIRVALEKGQREVRIRLDPPELGTLDVRIAVDGTDVRLTVRAEHAEASQLLQQSLQDLRLRLSQSGLQLVDADVDIATGDDGGGGRGDASRDRRERPSEDLADAPATERHKTKSKAVRAIA